MIGFLMESNYYIGGGDYLGNNSPNDDFNNKFVPRLLELGIKPEMIWMRLLTCLLMSMKLVSQTVKTALGEAYKKENNNDKRNILFWVL